MSIPESHESPDSLDGRASPRRGRGRKGLSAYWGEDARLAAGFPALLPTYPALAAQPFGWTLRDFLVPNILLSLSMQRAHGYFIEQYLRGLGLMDVEMSTLYRTLRQMERDGLVYSTWEPGPEGPARRIYSLTDAGRWWLDAGAAALAGYRAIIDRFFGSYSGPAVGPNRDDEKGASR